MSYHYNTTDIAQDRTPVVGITPFFLLVFFYFFTLHADQLNLHISWFHLRLNNLFAGALLILTWLRSRGLQLSRGVMIGLGLLSLSIVVSAVFGANLYRCFSYALFAFFTMMNYGALPFHWMQMGQTDLFLKLYFFSFWCMGFYAWLQLAFSFFGIYDPFCDQLAGSLVRPNAFTYEPSYYALAIVPLVSFINTLFISKKKYSHSPGVIKLICANVLLIISTSTGGVFSYGIYISTIIAMGCMPLIRSLFPQLLRRVMLFGLGAISSILMLVFFAETWSEEYLFKFFYKGFFAHHSFFERWMTIVNSWSVFLEHPWFGVGLGGIGPFVLQAYQNGNSAILIRPFLREALNYKTFDPENVLLELLASLGVFGVLAFGWLLWLFHGSFRRVLKNELISVENKQYAFAFFVSTVTLLGTLLFNQGILRTYVWVHFFISLGFMHHLLRESKRLGKRR